MSDQIKSDLFKIIITALVSVITGLFGMTTWIARDIHGQVREIETRLRTVEQDQKAILTKLDM